MHSLHITCPKIPKSDLESMEEETKKIIVKYKRFELYPETNRYVSGQEKCIPIINGF